MDLLTQSGHKSRFVAGSAHGVNTPLKPFRRLLVWICEKKFSSFLPILQMQLVSQVVWVRIAEIVIIARRRLFNDVRKTMGAIILNGLSL